MKHRIHLPVFLQRLHLQPLEQLLPAEEIVFQRGYQQTLSETARTTQEINLAFLYQTVNQIGFVHIHITVFYQLVEALYSNGVFHTIQLIIKIK